MPLDQHGNLSPGMDDEPGGQPDVSGASAEIGAGEGDSAAASAIDPATDPAIDPAMDPDDWTSFSCTRCGAPIPPSPALGALLVAMADLPADAPHTILCASCAEADSPPDATQRPSSQRVFRAEVRIRELSVNCATPDTWEDVAGFAIEGPGRTVREFTDSHAEEWAHRMEQVLKFADL